MGSKRLPNTTRLRTPTTTSSTRASALPRDDRARRPCSRRRGARPTSAPIASPSHQVRHACPYGAAGMTPPSQPLVTPMVALTRLFSPAASTISPRTSRRRSREGRNPNHTRQEHRANQRFQGVAQRHPAGDEHGRARPPIDEEGAPGDAGPKAGAIQHNAASAMPVGGQTAAAKPCTASRESPALAVTTKMTPSTPARIMSGIRIAILHSSACAIGVRGNINLVIL